MGKPIAILTWISIAALASGISATTLAASLSSANSTQKLVISSPQKLSTLSGRNYTDNVQIIYGYAQTGPYSPHAWHHVYASGRVCGTTVVANRMSGRGDWHTNLASVKIYVPSGCAWRISVSYNGYGSAWTVHRQELSLQ